MTLAEKIELVRSSFNEVAFGWNDSGSFWHVHYGPRGTGDMMAGFGRRFDALETETCDLEEALDQFIATVLPPPATS